MSDPLRALQRLHELAHPEGTAFIEYCREPECREMAGVYGLVAAYGPAFGIINKP